MALLKNKDTNTEITRFVSLKEKQEVIRIVHKTLDGAQYIQRIGEPAKSYELTLFVNDQGKEKLMQAEDSGALLEVTVGSGIYSGRIVELKEFERISSNFYKTTAVIAKEPGS
jgi:hypothetical protein